MIAWLLDWEINKFCNGDCLSIANSFNIAIDLIYNHDFDDK